jgi:hypothetical protein
MTAALFAGAIGLLSCRAHADDNVMTAAQLHQSEMVQVGVSDTIDCLIDAEKAFIQLGAQSESQIIPPSVQLCQGHLLARTAGTVKRDDALNAVKEMAVTVLHTFYSR